MSNVKVKVEIRNATIKNELLAIAKFHDVPVQFVFNLFLTELDDGAIALALYRVLNSDAFRHKN